MGLSLKKPQHRNHKLETLTEQFREKNVILKRNFDLVSPLDYYTEIFSDLNLVIPFVEESKSSVRRLPMDEIMMYSIGRDDIYVPYCTFLNNWYRKSTADRLFAFIVDVDGLNPPELQHFFLTRYYKVAIRPSFIVNSGSGLHLIFLLDESFPCYHRHHAALDAIQKGLCDLFRPTGKYAPYKIDRHWWGHSYRAAGSCTKIGQTATVFKVIPHRRLNLFDLATYFKVKIDRREGRQGKSLTMKKKGTIIDFKTGRPVRSHLGRSTRVFWDWAFEFVPHNTEPGHRYTSLFALAVIAQKCNIPEDEFMEKLKIIFDIYNDLVFRGDVNAPYLSEGELKKAINGYYDERWVHLTAAKLEELLGFKFPRKTKRVGRPRREHLIFAKSVRDARVKAATRLNIEKFLMNNPGSSQRQIASGTGYSLPTVNKYLKIYGRTWGR